MPDGETTPAADDIAGWIGQRRSDGVRVDGPADDAYPGYTLYLPTVRRSLTSCPCCGRALTLRAAQMLANSLAPIGATAPQIRANLRTFGRV